MQCYSLKTDTTKKQMLREINQNFCAKMVQYQDTLLNTVSPYLLLNNRTHFSDVDECASGTAECPENADCVNKENGYYCQCIIGYTLNATGSCVNIDECKDNTDYCNDQLATCTDFDGGYM